jgi:hypothetical protein
VILVIPTLFFESFIVIHLTYWSLQSSIDFLKTSANSSTQVAASNSLSNSYDEVFYCKNDLAYVSDLLNRKSDVPLPDGIQISQDSTDNLIQNIQVEKKSLLKKIYQSRENFKFSSRFVNAHVIAIVTLYYIFVFTVYQILKFTVTIDDYFPDLFSEKDRLPIRIGPFACYADAESCIAALQNLTGISVLIPKNMQTIGPDVKNAISISLISSAFVSLVICLFQTFFGVRLFRDHLTAIYKGKSNDLPERKSVNSMATSALHFTGYLVGHLIWGYVFFTVVVILIGTSIMLFYYLVGVQVLFNILLEIVPFIVAIILATITSKLASRAFYIDSKTPYLTLDNFHVYNLFLFFNCSFDCLMGVMMAMFRVWKSAIVGLFMMSRIR